MTIELSSALARFPVLEPQGRAQPIEQHRSTHVLLGIKGSALRSRCDLATSRVGGNGGGDLELEEEEAFPELLYKYL
jgi:hypothetical protein